MAKLKRKKEASEALVAAGEEDLKKARSLLSGLEADISFSDAKRQLKKRLGMSSGLAEAVVAALCSEGFEQGPQKSRFMHPNCPTEIAVVRGARQLDRFAAVSQVDPAHAVLCLPSEGFVPGDVVELRRSYPNCWTFGAFVRRQQRKWVCRFARQMPEDGVREEGHLLKPVSLFAPFEIRLDKKDVPASVDVRRDAVEVELDDAEARPKKMIRHCGGCMVEPHGAHFVRRVGAFNDPLGEIEIAAANHGVPVKFSDEALAEAEALPDKVDRRSLARRVDLTDLPFVTIDGEDARDFDDAVYCAETPEGWRLLVAIADVSHYVKPGSALDTDAQMRGTSVYFPASVVPMLPEKLSNGLCSLNPGVDRLVMVCDALIDKAGRTTAYQFYPGVIHSHARLTYAQAWSALQKEPAGLDAAGERGEDLKRLHSLCKVLREARRKRFALEFETQEPQVVFDAEGAISGFKARERNDAHRLIEECMLVANVCAASFVTTNDGDALFRVHDKPKQDRITALRSLLAPFGEKLPPNPTPQQWAETIERTKGKPFLQAAFVRAMPRACYQPDNIGHFGLQYEAYAHFTSPIRRYPDLLLHRTIRGILTKKRYVPKVEFDDAALMGGRRARELGAPVPGLADKEGAEAKKPLSTRTKEGRKAVWTRLGILASAAERRADDASRDVMQYLKCRFLSKLAGGKALAATVTGMCEAGVFVQLADMPIDGFVHVSKLGWGYYDFDLKNLTMTSCDEMKQICIGDDVKVRVESVEMDERRISFVLAGNESRHKIKRRRGRGRSAEFGDYF